MLICSELWNPAADSCFVKTAVAVNAEEREKAGHGWFVTCALWGLVFSSEGAVCLLSQCTFHWGHSKVLPAQLYFNKSALETDANIITTNDE